jgi:hypothetical protein
VPRMTPEHEAAYALRWNVDREDLSPAVQAEYDRLKIERETQQAELSAIAPPQPGSSMRQPPPWAYFVPLLVIWAIAFFWFVIGARITGPHMSFAILRSDVSLIRLPPGYVQVSSAQSGRDCAHNQCALAEFWVWRGSTARSASGACRDIDRAMNAGIGDAELNSLPPRGAACDYGATRDSFLDPWLAKRDVDAFVWTGPRATGRPGGFQVELMSANFYDFTPLRSPSHRAGS